MSLDSRIVVPGWTRTLDVAQAADVAPRSDFVPAAVVSIAVLDRDGQIIELDLQAARRLDPTVLAPVRSPRPYHGQRHLPSYVYSITQGEHVYAESHFEANWLLILDWSPSVVNVAAQPFTVVVADAEGREIAHTPDLVVATVGGPPVIVNIRPAELAREPQFVRGVAITRWLAEELGWEAILLHEPPAMLLRNLRWLRVFARPAWGLEAHIDKVEALVTIAPCAIGALVEAFDRAPQVVPAVMHLLWHHRFVTDLRSPIDWDSVVRMAEVPGA